MARYLVVAHQTARSPELHDRVRQLMHEDPHASFALLVPSTPVNHLLTWEEGETREVARRTAEAAGDALREAGATVTRVATGSQSPILAIEDELRDQPGAYDHLVICTFPLGISRWLGLDLVHQAERRTGLPVTHVVAQSHVPAEA